MITFTQLNNEKISGRLGNNLFQIASTIGMAKKNSHDYGFPVWKHSHAFKRNLPIYNNSFCDIKYIEETFCYDELDVLVTNDKSIDLFGYFQSEKYWKGYENEIKNQFEFTEDFIKKSISGYEYILYAGLPVISIHVRRGDYINNDTYQYLRMNYYYNALKQFGDLQQYSILIFSDDIEYCKVQFECLDNVFFVEKPALESLCLMTMCDHFICANSTFSWWGAYLGRKAHSKIFRPEKYFKKDMPEQDFWPEYYEPIQLTNKLDAQTVTPYTLDSKDREENLDIINSYLQEIGLTQIYIAGELENFHRTKLINDAIKSHDNDCIINMDADCLVPYLQLAKAIEMIRSGEADFVYPYTEWCKVPRSEIKNIKHDDVGYIKEYKIRKKGVDLGGCIVMSRKAFMEAGMENERFVGYGCEDKERFIRWNTLYYKVRRVKGKLFHLEHFRGKNSSSLLCETYKDNLNELDKVSHMDNKNLKNYIKTWPWIK